MNGQLEKPIQKYKILMLVEASSKPHDIVIYIDDSVTMTGLVGVHSQAGWKDCTGRQWSPQSHDLQSDHGVRSRHTCNTVACFPT